MYTMVLMMAVGGSADATAFGGRNKGCSGGAVVASYGCSGSYAGCSGSGYVPAYSGCTGGSYAGCTGSGYAVDSGSCSGSRKPGLLARLCGGRKSTGCTGSVASYSGCSGYVAAPAYSPCCAPAPVAMGGCFGSSYAAPSFVGGPAMMGGVPCMTPGMAPLAAPAMTPAPADKMPAGETKPATPPATGTTGGTKI